MMPLTPSILIAAASTFVGLREEGGNNRGLMIEMFLAGVSQKPGQPWCAAFVHHVGKCSHYDHAEGRSVWPLPATASCWMLGDFAKRHNILMGDPEAGDVFLCFDPALRRFAHTGVVARVEEVHQRPTGGVWYDCTTIEGNTNQAGSREGNSVARKRRRFYPELGDRFIRWVLLDERRLKGNPVHEPGEAA